MKDAREDAFPRLRINRRAAVHRIFLPLVCAAVVALVPLSGAGSAAGSLQNLAPSIDVRLSLSNTALNSTPAQSAGSGSETVLLPGEPLVLRYDITESGVDETTVLLSYEGGDWLEMRLEDEQGQMKAVTDPRRLFPGLPAGFRHGFRFNRGSTRTEVRALRPEWLGELKPGKYRLHLRARLPHSPDNLSQYLLEQKKPLPVLSREFVLPFTVTRLDTVTLRSRIVKLRERILSRDTQSTPGLTEELAVELLYAFPDEYADAHRQAMLRDPRATAMIKSYVFGMGIMAEREKRYNPLPPLPEAPE